MTTATATISLPLKPPYEPMEARTVEEIPGGGEWQYEPKWDGFRCIAFRDGKKVFLQSKSGQPLARYFPEAVAALLEIDAGRFVLDGEIVVPVKGSLSFDDLLQRIHPAASRVKMLAETTPAVFIVFDLLVSDRGTSLVKKPVEERRRMLEDFNAKYLVGSSDVRLSPATTDIKVVRGWFRKVGSGLDGIIAKRLGIPYMSGERSGMVKVKHLRTADCVVGGFRYAEKKNVIGSILLGLYDDEGLLHPEVQYDHFTGGRFRHGTRLIRWRAEKRPEQCTFEQLGREMKSPLVMLDKPKAARSGESKATRRKKER